MRAGRGMRRPRCCSRQKAAASSILTAVCSRSLMLLFKWCSIVPLLGPPLHCSWLPPLLLPVLRQLPAESCRGTHSVPNSTQADKHTAHATACGTGGALLQQLRPLLVFWGPSVLPAPARFRSHRSASIAASPAAAQLSTHMQLEGCSRWLAHGAERMSPCCLMSALAASCATRMLAPHFGLVLQHEQMLQQHLACLFVAGQRTHSGAKPVSGAWAA